MFFEVIPTEVYRSGGGALTYSSEIKLAPGQIVLIPLGKKTVTGIVYRRVPKVNFPTKPITKLICPIPIPIHLLKSTFWLSKYYLSPLPLSANLIIPAGIATRNALKSLSETPKHISSSKSHTSKLKQNKALPEPPIAQKDAPVESISLSPSYHSTSNIPESSEAFSSATASSEAVSNINTSPNSISNTTIFPEIPLNPAQAKALSELTSITSSTRLLRGITGSGKTNIYLKLTASTLASGKSAILLVPEIALTSQLVKIFEQTFGNRVILIHSQQTPAKRRDLWIDILKRTSKSKPSNNSSSEVIINKLHHSNDEASIDAIRNEPPQPIPSGEVIVDEVRGRNEARNERYLEVPRVSTGISDEVIRDKDKPAPEPIVIIGPRSALLSPIHNLGLIIIDEAHEGAYYQENPPRYSALRLASFMASTCKIPCILGTATPNIVDYHLAKSKTSLVELSQKAKSTAIDSKITVVDLKNRDLFIKNRYFSSPLLTAIENNVKAKHQTLIFHNRRGSAPMTLCEECGWQALCPNCFLPLILHADSYTLSCHTCDHQAKVPSTCPNCHHTGIIHKGFGTKLLESELKKLFPDSKIARFDGDNDKNSDLANLYDSVKSGEIDILIGTQTLARGLDLPHLATVGIIQADAGLSLPDFAAEERTFELLTQVIGRVGRGHLDIANVIIQSYQPNHPVIQAAIANDYSNFASYLLKRRREQQMPPFTYLARLNITFKTEKTALAKITEAYTSLSKNPDLQTSPPMPAFHERTNRGYTWQLIIRSTSREKLRTSLIPFAGNTGYTLTLDPPSLL